MSESEKQELKNEKNEEIKEFGQLDLDGAEHRISMLTIIGEIEGHECLPSTTKTTKYEHVLPKLAAIDEDKEVD